MSRQFDDEWAIRGDARVDIWHFQENGVAHVGRRVGASVGGYGSRSSGNEGSYG
jgi:hypothetical protein